MTKFGTESNSSVTTDSSIQASGKSSTTTESPEPQTTESWFGTNNPGILAWRKQRAEAYTLKMDKHLAKHGSKRITPGAISANTRITVLCPNCGKTKTSKAKTILGNDSLLCRSCASRLRQVGNAPIAATEAAAATARERSLRGRLGMTDAQFESLRHWANSARQRCINPKSVGYKDYGGRGIRFEFSSPTEAITYVWGNLGPKPEGMEIDRINNDGHYAPGNLRYATRSEQQQNKRAYYGPAYGHRMQRLLALRPDYTYEGLRPILKKGLSDKEILAMPKGKGGRPRLGTSSTADPGTDS